MCQVASQQGKTERKSSTENTEAKEQSCEMWEEGSWQQSPAGPVLLQSVKHVTCMENQETPQVTLKAIQVSCFQDPPRGAPVRDGVLIKLLIVFSASFHPSHTVSP